MFHREHMHLLGLACPTNLMMGTPTHILYLFFYFMNYAHSLFLLTFNNQIILKHDSQTEVEFGYKDSKSRDLKKPSNKN